MIFTSNYARSGAYSLSFAISKKPPDWYTGKCLPQLAPTWELLNAYKKEEISQDDYVEVYIALLKKRQFTPQRIVDALPHNSRLLCYESPGEFCHRRVLAHWIEDEIGLVIPEYISEEQLKIDAMVDELLEF